jgi:ABC-type oligopeptide transport system substrate-binding subunit
MADKGWQRKFDDPIDSPDGTRLTAAAETEAAYFFNTSKWQILSVTHVGAPTLVP